jgi:DNA-binding transcriptional ArsR family regulator
MAETAIEWADRPRTVDPRGYVLIRIPDHHRADVRGYVYEHLLVAERTAGRTLVPGERVRHRDGNPSNNNPDNIEVQAPADRSIYVDCACGCGVQMPKFDSSGRSRTFVSGHNPPAAPTRQAILAALGASPGRCLSGGELAEAAGVTVQAARAALSKMAAAGSVDRPRVGYYRLPGSAAPYPPLAAKRPKAEFGAGLPAHFKDALLEDFRGLCAYGCGRNATVWDHLIPWALGGSFRWAGNVVPACATCNASKNDSPPGPWVRRAFMSDYAAEPMDGVLCLAVSWGMAVPEDFMTDAELALIMNDQSTTQAVAA